MLFVLIQICLKVSFHIDVSLKIRIHSMRPHNEPCFSRLLDGCCTVCFRSLSCWRSHVLRLRQRSLTLGCMFLSHLDNPLISLWPAQVPQRSNITEPLPRFSLRMVFFSFKALFLFLWTYDCCDFPKSSHFVSTFCFDSSSSLFPLTLFSNLHKIIFK